MKPRFKSLAIANQEEKLFMNIGCDVRDNDNTVLVIPNEMHVIFIYD